MSSFNETILSTGLIVRHGARGPLPGELDALRSSKRPETSGPGSAPPPLSEAPSNDATLSPVIAQWDASEIETLTEQGREQMRQMGAWTERRAANAAGAPFGPASAAAPTEWRVGPATRNVQSGQEFAAAFNGSCGSGARHACAQVETPKPVADPPGLWKGYQVLQPYMDYMAELRSSAAFNAKADEHLPFLTAMFNKLGTDVSEKTPSKVLWNATYLSLIGDSEAHIDRPDRRVYTDTLTREEREQIDDIACFVWAQRFINNDFCLDLAAPMLVELLEELRDAIAAGKPLISVWCGSDHLNRCVMGALLALEPSLNWTAEAKYSSYFNVDIVKRADVERPIAKFSFNKRPFQHGAEGGHKVSRTVVEENEVALCEFPLDDLLQRLQAHLAKLVPPSPGTAAASRGLLSDSMS